MTQQSRIIAYNYFDNITELFINYFEARTIHANAKGKTSITLDVGKEKREIPDRSICIPSSPP